jgi:hypothetical protein
MLVEVASGGAGENYARKTANPVLFLCMHYGCADYVRFRLFENIVQLANLSGNLVEFRLTSNTGLVAALQGLAAYDTRLVGRASDAHV